MCQFVSWIETRDGPRYLTGDQVYHTERGKELREYTKCAEDYCGHGAIRWYYNMAESEGQNYECTDFSSPTNFPPPIVDAIKRGAMRGMGTPRGLLTQEALAEYNRVRLPARAEYDRVCQAALAEYERVCRPAQAEYDRVCRPALAEYDRVCQPAWAEYDRITDAAFWDLVTASKNRIKEWR